jgi:hypothetical protein
MRPVSVDVAAGASYNDWMPSAVASAFVSVAVVVPAAELFGLKAGLRENAGFERAMMKRYRSCDGRGLGFC